MARKALRRVLVSPRDIARAIVDGGLSQGTAADDRIEPRSALVVLGAEPGGLTRFNF